MSKCIGCGIELNYEDENNLGYVIKNEHKLCQRCFNLRNYNKENNNAYIVDNQKIINEINKMNHFTLFLCDLINLNEETVNIYNQINNDKIFVITKSDIFPLNFKKEHIKDNISKVYDITDVILTNVINKEGYLEITNLIRKHKTVIFAGPTSSGKSSLINGLIGSDITVSNYKNTTMDFMKLRVEDCIIIDSPGFNTSLVSLKLKGAIKPKTLTLNKDYVLIVNDYELYFCDKVNLTLFLPNNVIFKTKKKNKDFINEINITKKSDIVLGSLGFIYLKKGSCFINKLDNVSIRASVVGRK